MEFGIRLTQASSARCRIEVWCDSEQARLAPLRLSAGGRGEVRGGICGGTGGGGPRSKLAREGHGGRLIGERRRGVEDHRRPGIGSA